MGPSTRIAVYVEGLRGRGFTPLGEADSDSRITVNPVSFDEGVVVGGIRLVDPSVFQADPVLLPPGASNVETGPLDTPAAGWRPAHPDSRGVLEVPSPQESGQQYESAPNWVPSGGIRYGDSLERVTYGLPVAVQETFQGSAPLLPMVEPDYEDEHFRHQPLTDADWCAIRMEAETSSESQVEYDFETFADIAGGPLPDGGGTGSVITRAGRGPYADYTDAVVVSRPGGSCATATMSRGGAMTIDLSSGSGVGADLPVWPPANMSSPSLTAALVWTSPAKRSYLVVAAGNGVAKLRVSGPVSASVDGRWLVVPLPYVNSNGDLPEPPLVEAFDAAGHRCGDPDPAVQNGQYCYFGPSS